MSPPTMAKTLPGSSLNSLPSSPSSSSNSSHSSIVVCSSLPTQILTTPEISSVYSCCAKLQLIPHHTTTTIRHPVLLLTGFDTPPPTADTQSFLATVSVLAAIALSLFLGLRVNFNEFGNSSSLYCHYFIGKFPVFMGLLHG